MHVEAERGTAVAGSFRDPAGFVFSRDGRLYRQINRAYDGVFRALTDSGLYRRLIADGLLVAHEEVAEQPLDPATAARVIRPQPVPFISYPHEWSFSQLRDAALLTLAVQKCALGHAMVLKDASAFNVQFRDGRPIHIDTLSFLPYREGEPWLAYRQFCEHFLAPLAVCGLVDPRLGRMLAEHLDGLPLDLAARMLPWRSLLKPGLALHVHLHARFQRRYENSAASAPRARLSRHGMLALVDSLERSVAAVRPRARATVWSTYDDCEVARTRARSAARQHRTRASWYPRMGTPWWWTPTTAPAGTKGAATSCRWSSTSPTRAPGWAGRTRSVRRS
jgi:hypothetical protein